MENKLYGIDHRENSIRQSKVCLMNISISDEMIDMKKKR